MPPLAVLSEFRVADPGGVTIVEFEDQRIRNVVVVSACGAGTFEICKTQFDEVSCRLTPIVCGPPPGPLIRPDTITYSTAARTTVIATMRMVAITGDTAASSLRMTFFIGFVLLRLSPLPHTGTLNLINVSRLIFEAENQFGNAVFFH